MGLILTEAHIALYLFTDLGARHGVMCRPDCVTQPRMVELKNGETYSGVLASCDGFMNLPLAGSSRKFRYVGTVSRSIWMASIHEACHGVVPFVTSGLLAL